MIGGGASQPPRRWSLPAQAALIRSRSAYRSTARMKAQSISKNCRLLSGFLPGESRFSPVSVHSEKLLCLPEPLTLANGFSCSRQARPCFLLMVRIVSIISWLWSQAMLAVEYSGASSCWAGAASLCLVLLATPISQRFLSRSCINSPTRMRMRPQ